MKILNEASNLIIFRFLPEPRIALKMSNEIVNPIAVMYNKPYSYDEAIDGSQLAFFFRSKYKKQFKPIVKELVTILSDEKKYGLTIPKERSEIQTYGSDPKNLNSLINEVRRKVDAKLYVMGLPSKIINARYFEIKALFLREGIRVQLIKDDDFTSNYVQASSYNKRMMLYNLANAIYTKLGGTPWIFSEPIADPNSIIVGVGFGRVEETIYIGTSYVKDIYGVDLEFKLIPKFALHDVKTQGLYLPQDRLKKLLDGLLSRYNPQSIYFYKTSRFIPRELVVFSEYIDKVKLILVYINRFRSLRAFEDKSTVRRGLLVGLKDLQYVNSFKHVKFLLWTTGNLILVETDRKYNHRLGTPKGLEVNVFTNSDEIIGQNELSIMSFEEFIGEQILALTKLNWNTLAWEIREPAITVFARKAARIAAELERLGAGSTRPYDVRDFI